MRKFPYFIGVALLLVSAGGCAVTPPNKAFNPTAAEDVRVIGLLRPANPVSITLIDSSALTKGAAGGLGLLPLLAISGGMDSSKTKHTAEFAAAMNEPLQYSDLMTDALQQLLTAAGYTVVTLEASRSKPDDFVISYPQSAPRVHAYLDTATKFVGFHKGAGDRGLVPEIALDVRLTSAVSRAPLYSATIRARPGLTENATNDQYHFPTYDKLIQQPDKGIEGLKASIVNAADLIVADLDPDSPRIGFVRSSSFWVAGNPVSVIVDGRDMPMTSGYLEVRVPLGRHSIEATRQDGVLTKRARTIQVDSAVGKTTCVEVVHSMGGVRVVAMAAAACDKALTE